MKKIIPLTFLLALLLISCSPVTESSNKPKENGPAPTLEELESGLGGIVGTYEILDDSSSTQIIQVFAAPYLGDPEGEGVFVYEENMENSTYIKESGFFQIPNLSPGYYILLFGPDIDQAEAYQSQGKAIKVIVSANEFTDVGIIN
ncbi:hypothetical protein KQH50_01870 [bacterium]|nr:hypothetical protein [bacterium]